MSYIKFKHSLFPPNALSTVSEIEKYISTSQTEEQKNAASVLRDSFPQNPICRLFALTAETENLELVKVLLNSGKHNNEIHVCVDNFIKFLNEKENILSLLAEDTEKKKFCLSVMQEAEKKAVTDYISVFTDCTEKVLKNYSSIINNGADDFWWLRNLYNSSDKNNLLADKMSGTDGRFFIIKKIFSIFDNKSNAILTCKSRFKQFLTVDESTLPPAQSNKDDLFYAYVGTFLNIFNIATSDITKWCRNPEIAANALKAYKEAMAEGERSQAYLIDLSCFKNSGVDTLEDIIAIKKENIGSYKLLPIENETAYVSKNGEATFSVNYIAPIFGSKLISCFNVNEEFVKNRTDDFLKQLKESDQSWISYYLKDGETPQKRKRVQDAVLSDPNWYSEISEIISTSLRLNDIQSDVHHLTRRFDNLSNEMPPENKRLQNIWDATRSISGHSIPGVIECFDPCRNHSGCTKAEKKQITKYFTHIINRVSRLIRDQECKTLEGVMYKAFPLVRSEIQKSLYKHCCDMYELISMHSFINRK